MDQKRSLNYPAQLALLLGLGGVFLLLSSVLVLLGTFAFDLTLTAIDKPENVTAARILNSVASFCCFFLPAFGLASYLNRKPLNYLGFNTRLSAKQLLLILGFSFAAILLNGALGALNEQIPLPKNLYDKAKALEETYRRSMLTMAQMKHFGDYLITLLTVAVAPAIFEEVLFRGGLQPILVGMTKSKWTGIILTSILFSAIHFSYFGFLPRLALGMVLGFVFHYSKNLWLSIFLHFLNNAIVITQLYLLLREGKPIEKSLDETMPVWWGLIGLALLLFLFRLYRRESERKPVFGR